MERVCLKFKEKSLRDEGIHLLEPCDWKYHLQLTISCVSKSHALSINHKLSTAGRMCVCVYVFYH
jgi:hypothetical protein